MNGIEQIGDISQQQIDAAHVWHKQLPDVLLENAANPYGAQALILALLLHEDTDIENKQYSVLLDVLGELHTQNIKQVQTNGEIEDYNWFREHYSPTKLPSHFRAI